MAVHFIYFQHQRRELALIFGGNGIVTKRLMIKLGGFIVHRLDGAFHTEHGGRHIACAAVIGIDFIYQLPHLRQRLFWEGHADIQRVRDGYHIFFLYHLFCAVTGARCLCITGYQVADVRFHITAFQLTGRKAAQLFCAAQHGKHARQGIYKASHRHHGPQHNPGQHFFQAFFFQFVQHTVSSFTHILAFAPLIIANRS